MGSEIELSGSALLPPIDVEAEPANSCWKVLGQAQEIRRVLPR